MTNKITASQRNALIKVIQNDFAALRGSAALELETQAEAALAESRAKYASVISEYNKRVDALREDQESLNDKITDLMRWARNNGLRAVRYGYDSDRVVWNPSEMQPVEISDLRAAINKRHDLHRRRIALALQKQENDLTRKILLAEAGEEAREFIAEIPSPADLLKLTAPETEE